MFLWGFLFLFCFCFAIVTSFVVVAILPQQLISGLWGVVLVMTAAEVSDG